MPKKLATLYVDGKMLGECRISTLVHFEMDGVSVDEIYRFEGDEMCFVGEDGETTTIKTSTFQADECAHVSAIAFERTAAPEMPRPRYQSMFNPLAATAEA